MAKQPIVGCGKGKPCRRAAPYLEP